MSAIRTSAMDVDYAGADGVLIKPELNSNISQLFVRVSDIWIMPR